MEMISPDRVHRVSRSWILTRIRTNPLSVRAAGVFAGTIEGRKWGSILQQGELVDVAASSLPVGGVHPDAPGWSLPGPKVLASEPAHLSTDFRPGSADGTAGPEGAAQLVTVSPHDRRIGPRPGAVNELGTKVLFHIRRYSGWLRILSLGSLTGQDGEAENGKYDER